MDHVTQDMARALLAAHEEIGRQNEIQNLLMLNDMAHVNEPIRGAALQRAIDMLGLR